jgi:hypothetical protein
MGVAGTGLLLIGKHTHTHTRARARTHTHTNAHTHTHTHTHTPEIPMAAQHTGGSVPLSLAYACRPCTCGLRLASEEVKTVVRRCRLVAGRSRGSRCKQIEESRSAMLTSATKSTRDWCKREKRKKEKNVRKVDHVETRRCPVGRGRWNEHDESRLSSTRSNESAHCHLSEHTNENRIKCCQ